MDLGITLMEQYGEQFTLLEQQRQEFGMPLLTILCVYVCSVFYSEWFWEFPPETTATIYST